MAKRQKRIVEENKAGEDQITNNQETNEPIVNGPIVSSMTPNYPFTYGEIVPMNRIEVRDYNNLIGKLIIVKIGDKDYTATDEDVNNMTESLTKLFQDAGLYGKCIVYVTNKPLDIKVL